MPVTPGPKGVEQEMHKFKGGTLHSGSPKGPIVKNRKQAIAIALKESGQSRTQPNKPNPPNPPQSFGAKVKRPKVGGLY